MRIVGLDRRQASGRKWSTLQGQSAVVMVKDWGNPVAVNESLGRRGEGGSPNPIRKPPRSNPRRLFHLRWAGPPTL